MAEILSDFLDEKEIRVLYEYVSEVLEEDGKAKLDRYLNAKGYRLESLQLKPLLIRRLSLQIENLKW